MIWFAIGAVLSGGGVFVGWLVWHHADGYLSTGQIEPRAIFILDGMDSDSGEVAMVSPAAKTVVPFNPVTQEADTLDTAGQTILGLLQQAAGMAEENSKHALEVAQRLSQQLQDAKGRIRDLEADVKYYQERAERADQWMAHISSQIQQRLLSAPPAPNNRRY